MGVEDGQGTSRRSMNSTARPRVAPHPDSRAGSSTDGPVAGVPSNRDSMSRAPESPKWEDWTPSVAETQPDSSGDDTKSESGRTAKRSRGEHGLPIAGLEVSGGDEESDADLDDEGRSLHVYAGWVDVVGIFLVFTDDL